MTGKPTIERLFQRYVENHVVHGTRLSLEELCGDRTEPMDRLRVLIAQYHRVDETMSKEIGRPTEEEPEDEAPPPEIAGFQTIERIGRGGMGEVYKVRDLKLDRVIAAKVLRRDSTTARAYGNFLGEARSMALFRDRRIVQIHEFRSDADPPVILMEHIEGFELDRVAPSLDFRQRARILLEICEAVEHAHILGIQHRDLKPSNILLDSSLSPRILDFGLSSGDPNRGHLVGTPAYMAPEQLDPSRSIDARSDIYALGVIFYEVLCGQRPHRSDSPGNLAGAMETGRPPLPVEIDASVPEPLQAVALKAMESDPDHRYASAREMAVDLQRYLDGRPVLARPSMYSSVLNRRLLPHLDEIEEWLRLKLIYPHEARNLRGAYARLEQRDDDWIVQSRALSYSQVSLYLGVLVLLCGGLLYFAAHRFFDAVEGVAGPLLYLGVPFVGLSVAAHQLYRREHKAVAVAYYLGSTMLLPVLLLILFHEAGWWAAEPAFIGDQFFGEQEISNRQLQIAVFLTCGWSAWLAFRTRTIGLGSLSTLLLVLFSLAVLTDFGLDDWIDESRWDLLALHLSPVVAIQFLLAWWLERARRVWFSLPLYVGFAMLLVVVLELLALDGKAFGYIGISMSGLQTAEATDPTLLDTLTAMSLNGIVFFLIGSLMESRGTRPMGPAAWILVVISPFAILHPVGWLVTSGDYSLRYDWLYLILALIVIVLSHYRQRKS
ncbi:MAG: serine/threonine protein kinase, partial [Deltaproteobacteria bacterium]|nr:serine/threonine protein kinase [Deltaproteobacteria bacterium]